MTPPNHPIVNDASGLNPVPVWAVVTPKTVEEVAQAVAKTDGPISVGGSRFSMGGQIASAGSLHIDMRGMNRVVSFSPLEATIRVQAGIRWREVQRFIDPHDMSVKIMQAYANFTVGGSLSVNAHGRYMGLGPLILSVRSIRIVLADGSLLEASSRRHSEIFYGAIGGYGALGVIVEAELDLAPNIPVKRVAKKVSLADYVENFRSRIFTTQGAIFHNADLYPPQFTRLRSVSWVETDERVTEQQRLQMFGQNYQVNRYFTWAISETRFGRWRREYLLDPLIDLHKKVHWRNFEASYDVAELEPSSRQNSTYLLQEYFVPAERLAEFIPKIAEILRRYGVNAVNVSVRHSPADPGSLLAWAKGETFALVLYCKQRTRGNAKDRVVVWTRELIDAAISVGGAYYLPYQIYATRDQFHAAYPRAGELFVLKAALDPQYRFRNALWDTYYAPTLSPAEAGARDPLSGGFAGDPSLFRSVYSNASTHDGFYRFLQNIYRMYPEDRIHSLIRELSALHESDEAIYRNLLRQLPKLKPALAEMRHVLPARARQNREIARQAAELLGEKRVIRGYVEIGSGGRHVGALRRHLTIKGPVVLVNDRAPGYSAADIAERGRISKRGRFAALKQYQPLSGPKLADDSFDLISCFEGLHHVPPAALDGFIGSIVRLLRPGGLFILRDHDVASPQAAALVSLAHTVVNAGRGLPWEDDQREARNFVPAGRWSGYLEGRGLEDAGRRLREANDPTDNLMMAFIKPHPIELEMSIEQPTIPLVESIEETPA
jgi:FAD/FMN-containing dehydrogenase/SAM-dependent methyltransferase